MSEIHTVIKCEICNHPCLETHKGEYNFEEDVLYYTVCQYCGHNDNATRLSFKQDDDRMIIILDEV